ncbi:uncharacterized protein Dmoj_GI26047 [Drosophila mojavensis]|uniref:Uncharacterized protein n=2 Tax=Drosophila mojavensis TaxID=7230 RepID=A0A0Q9XKJ2_DROMO|nr:uncharacterized protein Dmoj_GI26047 [Drosophila mojavensis]
MSCKAERNWDYEALFITSRSSDESLVSIESGIERKGRGSPTVSIVLEVNYQVDDETLIEATVYQSYTGHDDDYKLMPFGIEKKPFPEYIREFYDNVVYTNLGHCSNLPKPGEQIPWPIMTYKFDDCIFSGDGLPEILSEGYYKIFFNVTGPVDWSLVIGVKIVSKSNAMGYY